MTFSRIALVHSGFALLRPVWRERPQNQGMAGRRTRNARFSMRNAAEKPVPGPATILMRRVPRRRNAPKRSETTVLETNVFGHFGQEDCVGLSNAFDLRSNSQSPSRAQAEPKSRNFENRVSKDNIELQSAKMGFSDVTFCDVNLFFRKFTHRYTSQIIASCRNRYFRWEAEATEAWRTRRTSASKWIPRYEA